MYTGIRIYAYTNRFEVSRVIRINFQVHSHIRSQPHKAYMYFSQTQTTRCRMNVGLIIEITEPCCTNLLFLGAGLLLPRFRFNGFGYRELSQ